MKSNATRPWPYMRADILHAGPIVRLRELADFIRYASASAPPAILLLPDTAGGDQPAIFGFFHNGVLLQLDTAGYASLEDYQQSAANGFPDAATFYLAHTGGYRRYEDYQLALASGAGEAATLEAMRAGGFLEGFGDWKKLEGVPDIGPVTDAHDLYRYAVSAGFDNYAALREALVLGFRDGGDYKLARQQGFPDAATYEDAVRRGFLSYADYTFAEEHRLRDATDAKAFFDMALSNGGKEQPHDQKALLIFLSRLGEGKRISINKLSEHFEKALEGYHYPDTGALPPWFTTSLHGREDLTRFLAGDDARSYGTYDSDGEFFEVNRLRDRHVVIDGSNVAFNSSAAHGQSKTAYAANILRLVRFLRQKGFEQISVISDASLKHRLADEALLEQVREAAVYIEAPAEKPADLFLIQYVKNNHCLLVSNDTFREWKVREAWVAEHIDYYRLTFIIKGEEVLMPDLG